MADLALALQSLRAELQRAVPNAASDVDPPRPREPEVREPRNLLFSILEGGFEMARALKLPPETFPGGLFAPLRTALRRDATGPLRRDRDVICQHV